MKYRFDQVTRVKAVICELPSQDLCPLDTGILKLKSLIMAQIERWR